MTAESSDLPETVLCARCDARITPGTVRTAIWQGDRLAVVEDVPAFVCRVCGEQYYDDDVGDALRRLSEEGFPQDAADRTITVPVFSLTGRIRKRATLPEDTYVD